MRFARLALAVGALLVATAAGACREPTQISVLITTDVKCADVKGTSLAVGHLVGLDQRPVTTQTSACSEGRIGELVVVPSGDDDETVAVLVVLGMGRDPADCIAGGYGPGCIVARRAIRYIPHTRLTLSIFMSAVCNGIACGATETCVGGNCRPATIADSNLCTTPEGCSESALGSASSDAGTVPVAAPTPPPDAAAAQPISNATAPRGVAGTAMNDIFYTNSIAAGRIRHTDGGGITDVLVDDQNLPRCMAMSGATLWWANSGPGTLMTSTTAGQNVQSFVTGQTGISGVAIDATSLYWTWQGGIRKRTR